MVVMDPQKGLTDNEVEKIKAQSDSSFWHFLESFGIRSQTAVALTVALGAVMVFQYSF